MGDDPPGLNLNAGASLRPAVDDREAQIAALLTVRVPVDRADGQPGGAPSLFSAQVAAGGLAMAGPRRRDYEERRLEPGDTITIVGSALPFGDLDDPATADRFDPTLALDDPEVAMNLAEARAAGILEATAEEAWGNAAIPGFGIGRPARAPELDPGADHPVLASRGGGRPPRRCASRSRPASWSWPQPPSIRWRSSPGAPARPRPAGGRDGAARDWSGRRSRSPPPWRSR